MPLRIAFAAAFALLLSAAAQAAPGTAVSTVNMRTEPNTTSPVAVKIPGGAKVEIGDCTNGWCTVVYQGKSGFAIQTAFDMSGRAAVRRAPARSVRRPVPGVMPYDPDDEVIVSRPPVVVYGGGPYYGGWGPGPYWGRPYGYGFYRGYGPRWGHRRW